MTRPAQRRILEEVLCRNMKRDGNLSAFEALDEILAVVVRIASNDEDSLQGYGMPRDMPITREDRIEAIRFLVKYTADRDLLASPALTNALTTEDLDAFSGPLYKVIEEFTDSLAPPQ